MVSNTSFLWVANHVALDFVNTELIEAGARVDLLRDFEDVVRWLGEARMLGDLEPSQLLARFGSPRERAKVLVGARDLRAALRLVIDQRALGKRPPATALATINALLEPCPGRVKLVSTPAGIVRRFEREIHELRDLLQPVATAAAELLCDVAPARIKACANHACILYFLDTSKNQTRRWCSMAVCGNRMKVATHRRTHSEG